MSTATQSPWRAEAKRLIRKTIDDHVLGFAERLVPGDVLELRAKLREVYPFGPKSHYPYRIWCEEVRHALALPVRPRNRGVCRRKKFKSANIMPSMRAWAQERGLITEEAS